MVPGGVRGDCGVEMVNLSGASIEFTAQHFDALLNEGWHEHVWTITAWWLSEPFRDGRSVRAALLSLMESCVVIDGGQRRLPPHMWSNEEICRAVGTLANVVKVTVDRPGFHAEFWP